MTTFALSKINNNLKDKSNETDNKRIKQGRS